MRRLQVVSPYRPFAPESDEHRELGPFDWVAALQMMGESVRRSCRCPMFAITDVDTELPVLNFQFETTERRLMLWILDVSLRYLESPAFDRDTILISPDILVLRDLRPWLTADLGVIVRPEAKHTDRPILNQVQWWRYSAKDRLVAFYREVLDLARTLPEASIRWGADTVPFERLLAPLEIGQRRYGHLDVALIHASHVIEPLSALNIKRLAWGRPLVVTRPVLDFRYTRKRYMARAYESIFAQAEVPA